MTWTYDQPVEDGWADPIHEARFLLTDTTRSAYSPSDEELRLVLLRWRQTHPNQPDDLYYVAATAAEMMMRGYAGAVTAVTASSGNGSVSRTFAAESGRYRGLADWLWSQAATPRPGALSGFGRAARPTDTDLPEFTIGQMDEPGTTRHVTQWLEREL